MFNYLEVPIYRSTVKCLVGLPPSVTCVQYIARNWGNIHPLFFFFFSKHEEEQLIINDKVIVDCNGGD